MAVDVVASDRVAPRTRTSLVSALAAATFFGASVLPPPAHADAVAYLVNVTVRPGYGFANADDALAYGHRVCDKVAQGRRYVSLIDDLKADFNTRDDYQASYLVTQAVNELCPEQIWLLRNSAAGYRSGSPSS